MNFRKHWKHFLLSSAAFFWAGCGGDSESIAPENEDIHSTQTGDSVLIGEGTVALYGVLPVFDPDSGKITSSDSCGDSCHAESSSSDSVQSSSSEAAQSSSSTNPFTSMYGTYKLARDTSITCEVSEIQTFIMGSGKMSPKGIMDALENNKTRSIEELIELEDELEFESLGYATLYGVIPTSTGMKPSKYTCSNDSSYTASTHVAADGMLYSNAEYKEKYPDPVPSPLCQKTGFMSNGTTEELGVNKERFVGDMFIEYSTDKAALTDSVKTAKGDTLSDTQKNCLDNEINTLSSYLGPIASKQICDGDTTVNPRYQARLDSNKAYIQKQINNCLKEPE